MQASAYVRPMEEIDGPGVCGLERPLKVSGLRGGNVGVSPAATIGCPLTAALDRWIAASVQPAAARYFGSRVVGITQIASYGCRGRNGNSLRQHLRARLRQCARHGRLPPADRPETSSWPRPGGAARRASARFCSEIFAGACAEFYTVLGPGSDRYHYNHFHVDLLVSNARNGRHYCKPSPGRVPVADGGRRSAGHRLDQADPLHRPGSD